MKIDHIGYAVKRMEAAIKAFTNLGFSFESVIDDTDRNVRLAFGTMDGCRIELVSPLDKKAGSPVDEYLCNTFGMPYHICYESEDLDADIKELEQQGCKLVIKPRPAVAFSGRRVAFLMNMGFGLMEIVEAERKA